MYSRILVALIVVAVSINYGESAWMGGFTDVMSKVGKTALKVAQNPMVQRAAMSGARMALGDDELVDKMKELKNKDQDSYDQAIENMRSDFANTFSDETAEQMINGLESLVAMDAGEERDRANDEFVDSLVASMIQ